MRYLLILIASLAPAQTRVHGITGGAAPVDYSGASSTKPMKVGTSLPGTCAVGELFFKSDATAGQNIYECASTNTWTQQLNSGGGGGSSDGLTVTSTTSAITVASGGHCRVGNVRYEIPSAAVWTVSGSATGIVFVYCSIAGSTAQVTVGTTSGVGSCDDDCTSQTLSSSGFPAGSAPIATVAMTAGVLSTTPVDKRDTVSAYHGIAGTGIGKTSNADGSETWNNTGLLDVGTGLLNAGGTASVDPAIVPWLSTSNTFTGGLNDFSGSPLRITTGAGAPSGSNCNASGHVGKIYARNNPAAANATLYICSNTGGGTYAWELAQGAGGGGAALREVIKLGHYDQGDGAKYNTAHVIDFSSTTATAIGSSGSILLNAGVYFPNTGSPYISVVGGRIPSGWDGTLAIGLRHFTEDGGSGTGGYNVYVKCTNDAGSKLPTFDGTATAVSWPANTTQWRTNAMTSLTMTGSGCAAESYVYLKVQRDNAVGGNYVGSLTHTEFILEY